jgi:hypothetical protein
VTIIPDAHKTYFSSHPEESELAEKLDEAFDISFAKTHGELAFWIGNPKPRTRERFGLRKEVLIIYSPHLTTDARVLTAIENIIRSPDFKHRLDRVLFLLVHKGDPAATADLVHADRERIVIPIHANELLNLQRGPMFLRSRMTAELGAVDLFGMSSPLTSDKYFFGREEIVNLLVKRATVYRGNAGLFGLRKTGKTSVLFAIQRALSDLKILSQYVDCQNPGIHAARWWNVLENIIERCRETLKTNHKRDLKITGGYTKTNAGTRFTSDLSSLLDNGGLEQVLLLFDEIEFITPRVAGALGQHWDEDFVPFWQSIRAAHQELQGKIVFVVAGVNPAGVDKPLFGTLPNPIFQLATPIYLEPLSDSAVHSMVRSIGRYAGLAFGEDVFKYLAGTYGGHPYLVRIACSEVWRANIPNDPLQPQKIVIDNFRAICDEIRSRLAGPIKDILLSLVWWYPDEYELLQIMAAGDHEFVRTYLEANPGAYTRFVHYGLISANTTEFAIADVKNFLKEYGEEYKRELSPFTRSDMPMNILPEIPDLDLLGKLFGKRVQLEILLRKAIILYLGVKCTWNPECMAKAMASGLRPRPDRPDPKSLLVGRTPQDAVNELFLLDLKAIITENWQVFSPLFDSNKVRFEMNMDTVNIARRVDAHIKTVSEQEKSDFENSYAWLLARLDKLPKI